tara:strand:+ start:118 stop:408 length:291 start_codon:yes stop_codon:yes gene_type:complete
MIKKLLRELYLENNEMIVFELLNYREINIKYIKDIIDIKDIINIKEIKEIGEVSEIEDFGIPYESLLRVGKLLYERGVKTQLNLSNSVIENYYKDK